MIHLAAHGGYNVANPLYSAIYLAPGGEGAAGDGRLETHEVYGLDLKGNELVVLSACQTNVGELSAGDELVGLTRAFFFAGTPTILSSLWSVDDEATEALMTAFYRHWQAGMGKAEALQAAQAEVRANPQWASPFYWAGFVLNGDPGANAAKVSEPAAQPAESVTSPETHSVDGPTTTWPVLAARAACRRRTCVWARSTGHWFLAAEIISLTCKIQEEYDEAVDKTTTLR